MIRVYMKKEEKDKLNVYNLSWLINVSNHINKLTKVNGYILKGSFSDNTLFFITFLFMTVFSLFSKV